MRRIGLVFLLALGARGAEEGWRTETALEAPAKLNGCAIGDLDARRPGHEIATVCATGEVSLVRRGEDGGWSHERIATVEGEPIQCAIGDADPAHEGDELVVVGMKAGEEGPGIGAARLVRREGDGWAVETLFEDDALIHGVCIADLDPDRPGAEILVVGFTRAATLLSREGDGWRAERIADLGSAGKTAVPYRGGAAVACTAGTVVHVAKGEEGWRAEVLDRADAGQARLATDGERVLVACDDGSLGLVAGGERTVIHREEAKLRGAVLADLDPAAEGLEAATAGYSGALTVLYPQEGGGWRAATVFRDTGKFHHLVAGQLPGCGPAAALAACGYSRRLTVAWRSP